MPENDFEKQVQQALESFRLQPSHSVWTGVRKRTQREGRRKRALLLLPALLLLLGGGFTWYALDRQGDGTHTIREHNGKAYAKKAESKQDEYEGDRNHNTKDKHKSAPSADEGLLSQEKNNNVGDPQQSLVEKSNKGTAPSADDFIEPHHKQPAFPEKKEWNIFTKDRSTINPLHNNNPFAANRTTKRYPQDQADFTQNRNAPNNAGDIEAFKISGDQAIARPGTQQVIKRYPHALANEPIQDVSSASKLQTPIRISQPKKWEWGLSLSAGASRTSNNFFNSSQEKALMLQADNNFLFANRVNNSVLLAGAPPPTVSSVEMAIGAQLGVFVKRSITRRFSITSGMQYGLYTTRRLVGSKYTNNATPAGYNSLTSERQYSLGYSNKERNHYLFLELPLGLQVQLNRGRKIPLYAETGVSLGTLFNVSNLGYDSQAGRYHEDGDLFNKWQLNGYASVKAKLFARQARPLYIGPIVQLGLTNMYNEDSRKKLYLGYGGLQLQWSLGEF